MANLDEDRRSGLRDRNWQSAAAWRIFHRSSSPEGSSHAIGYRAGRGRTRSPEGQVWRRDTLQPADGRCRSRPIASPTARRARRLAARSTRCSCWRPERFELAACRALMGLVRSMLDDGIMFAVLDRLPMAEMDRDQSTVLYSLLGGLLAQPCVAEIRRHDHLHRSRRRCEAVAGFGIRPTVTNVGLTFHRRQLLQRDAAGVCRLLSSRGPRPAG